MWDLLKHAEARLKRKTTQYHTRHLQLHLHSPGLKGSSLSSQDTSSERITAGKSRQEFRSDAFNLNGLPSNFLQPVTLEPGSVQSFMVCRYRWTCLDSAMWHLWALAKRRWTVKLVSCSLACMMHTVLSCWKHPKRCGSTRVETIYL